MRKDSNTILIIFLVGALLFTASLAGCTEDGDDEEKTPTGDLILTESHDTPGLHTGSFENLSDPVKLKDVQVIITDSSKSQSDSINDLSSDKDAMVTDGLTLQFTDVNDNNKLDVGDTFHVTKAGTDDVIKFMFNPNVELIAQYTFEYVSTQTTPTGALDFTESTMTSGMYTGSFVSLSKSAQIPDVSWTISDDSTGNSNSQDPLNPGTTLTTGSGLNATYSDNNINNKIDGGDTIRCYNAASGDIVKFVYKPTGGVIASYTFV
jgi:hypothetical protein